VVILFQLEVKLNDVVQEVRAKVAGIRGTCRRASKNRLFRSWICGPPDRSLAVRSEVLSPGI